MSETALELSPRTQLAVTPEQIAIAKNTVAKGLDDDQFAVYLYNCQRQGIHPLDGLVIPIVRNDDGQKRLTFVTTVDLLRSRAAETNEYAGSDDAVYEYSADKPTAATVTVWRFVQGQKCAFTATARYAEYFPGEKQGFMWKSKPHVMLGKCAEGLALRKAFPKQLAGLYLEEELQQDTQAPRKAKVETKPMRSVKCEECKAEGGHLPSCKHNPKNVSSAGQPVNTIQNSPAKEAVKGEVMPKETTVGTFVIKGSKRMKRKNSDSEYLILSATTDAGDTDLFVWHKHLHEYLENKAGIPGDFETSTSTSNGKTYVSIEHIKSLNGVPFVDDKPTTITAQDLGFEPQEEEF